MAYVTGLRCSRCGRRYEPGDNPLMCVEGDLGRLDIEYDYDLAAESFSRESLRERPWGGVWRYWELMPVDRRFDVGLGEGGTPLIHAGRLAEELGVKTLHLKDETGNPTHSFKDRAMAVGVAKAREMNVRTAVIASSGNAAAALSAYSAKAGIESVALVPEDASMGKIAQLLLYGARVMRVRQTEEGVDPTVKLMLEAHRRLGWYPCPSFGPFNPYQVEGPKTMLYEILEQLGWRVPDFILVPTGSGCLLTGLWKACRDMRRLGLIDDYPGLVAVQPEGNQPLVKAIREGKSFGEIRPTPYPKSVASGLLDPFPWDGDAAMEGVRETGGTGVAVSDDEIMWAVKSMASREGVFAEPSGAAGLAGLRKLLDEGFISRSDEAVVLVTGSGLKEPEKVAGLFEKPPVIEPEISQLQSHLSSTKRPL